MSDSIKKIITEKGLVSAAVSVLAYLLTFLYEAGYASYFGMPIELITPSIINTFLVAAALLGVVWFVFTVTNVVYSVVSIKNNAFYQALIPLIPLFILLLGEFYIYGWHNWQKLVPLFLILLFFVFLQYGFPLITQRKKKNYVEKLKAQEIAERNTKSLWDFVVKQLGFNGALIFISLLLFCSFTYSAGHAAAMKKDDYLVVNTEPEMVVLRIYGENIICTSFERDTKKFQKNFRVINLPRNPNIVLRLENIGPLTLKEK